MSAEPTTWERYSDLFTAPGVGSALEGVRSRCAELSLTGSPAELSAAVLGPLELPGPPAAAVLTRFRPGDYALPQCPRAALGPADWYVYRALGDSVVDGLTYWTGREFARVLDVEQRTLALAPDAWYWTSPVRGPLRYAVLAGGRRA